MAGKTGVKLTFKSAALLVPHTHTSPFFYYYYMHATNNLLARQNSSPQEVSQTLKQKRHTDQTMILQVWRRSRGSIGPKKTFSH